MDHTLSIWKCDLLSGVWISETRLGNLMDQGLGFYGACWNFEGCEIIAHDYHGAFYQWKKEPKEILEYLPSWSPKIMLTGHFKSVKDVSWDKSGSYFMSVR
jgi:elongator complex protein 2